MQTEWHTVDNDDQLAPKEQSIWIYTVYPDLSVQKLRIIIVTLPCSYDSAIISSKSWENLWCVKSAHISYWRPRSTEKKITEFYSLSYIKLNRVK